MQKQRSSSKEETTKILSEYRDNFGAMEQTHLLFDDKEKMFMYQPTDRITKNETRSKLVDPTLTSAILKQNNTEMAQLPTGKVIALSTENRGKSLFMDLILHQQILPNANTQFDAYTKFWLLSLYRKIYGSFGVLVDYVSRPRDDYIGPDFTLIPARGIIPQKGKTTVEDSDYIDIRTSVSKSWVESKRSSDGWTNLDKMLEKEGDTLTSPTYNQTQNDDGMIVKGQYELVTRYYYDRWVTFHPGSNTVLRDINNAHKNNKIPVVMCHSYPLLDRFFGLGDYERGTSLHNALSGLINLYMDGVKMSIFPPMKIDPMAVSNWEDFKNGLGPGQIWLMDPARFNNIEQFRPSPSGIDSFQSTYQFLKASILTLTNTSDTSVSQNTDPGFGKTPQALKMQAFTQGMQSQFGRKMLEIAMEKVNNLMIDILTKRQEKDFKIYLKEKDVNRVYDVAPDVLELFETRDQGYVTIKANDIKDIEYRYEIDQGSTVKKDELMENESLTEIIDLLSKIPGAMDQLMQGGMIPIGSMQIDAGELLKRWIITKGVSDWDKIITDRDTTNAVNMESPQAQQYTQSMQPQFNDPAFQQINDELASLAGGING